MNIEQERAAFEDCFKSLGVGPYQPHNNMYVADESQARWEAWQARAALQSQHETQLQVWRSTDSCGEFWSWDEADQYDYDRAKPENRRVIQIIKEG